MPVLYRVFPYLAASPPDEPGGALYIPPQGAGRIDNPDLYSVLYVSNAPQGAVAEAFGRLPEWTRATLAGVPTLPGSIAALASYKLPDKTPLCDLDDAKQLLSLKLRPSEVVTRQYERSRAWARRIHRGKAVAGISWWSFYNSEWSSLGLWKTANLTLENITPLTLKTPALIEASRLILRRIAEK